MNRNFIVLKNSGECALYCNFGVGNDLDISILSSFATSLQTFGSYTEGIRKGAKKAGLDTRATIAAGRQSLVRTPGGAGKGEDGVTSFFDQSSAATKYNLPLGERMEFGVVTLHGEQYVFRQQGGFIFLLNCPSSEGEELCFRQIADVLSILEFILGGSEKWRTQGVQLSGLQDVIESCLTAPLQDPCKFIGGLPYVFKTGSTRKKLDELLTEMENDEFTVGAMILVEGIVLHSGLSLECTQLVRNFTLAREPEKWEKIRILPVYLEGRWNNLILYKTKWHVLCVLATIESSVAHLQPKLEWLEETIEASTVHYQIPIAKNSLIVDDFAGIDVIGFIFYDRSSAHTFAPTMRDDPLIKSHTEILLWFLKRSKGLLNNFAVTSVHLQKGGYRFFASEEDGYAMFVLCGDGVDAGTIEDEADRIITKIRLTFTL